MKNNLLFLIVIPFFVIDVLSYAVIFLLFRMQYSNNPEEVTFIQSNLSWTGTKTIAAIWFIFLYLLVHVILLATKIISRKNFWLLTVLPPVSALLFVLIFASFSP